MGRPAEHDLLARLGATPVAHGDGVLDRVREAAPGGVAAAAALVEGGHAAGNVVVTVPAG